MRITRPLAAAAVLAAAACGGSVPPGAPATAPPPRASPAAAAPAAPGAAFCARLRASGTPQVTYAGEVEHQTGLAGGGSVTPEAIQAARTIVALWITISCPQYAYLTERG